MRRSSVTLTRPPRALPSNAQILAHDLVRQFADRASSDAAALIKNAELARNAACERQLLFDQQHGKPSSLPARKVTATPVQHLFQNLKQVEDTAGNRMRAVLAHAQTDTQIFLYCQIRKYLTAFRPSVNTQNRTAVIT